MKIATFNDLHLHKHKDFAGPDGSRRLKDGLNILSVILEITMREGCGALVFTGDFFHNRRHIDVETFNRTRKLLKSKVLDGIEHKIIVPGNHDWYDRKCSTTSTQFLSEFGFTIFPQPASITIKDGKNFIELFLLPWMSSFSEQRRFLNSVLGRKINKRARRLLFTHSRPMGSSTPGGFTFDTGIDFGNYNDVFNYMFCGDIHKRQYMENLVVGGAPMHHNFGDSGEERGFHIYDSIDNNVEFISLKPFYPEFIMTKDPDVPKDDRHYYRLVTDDTGDRNYASNVSVVMEKRINENGRERIDIGLSPEETLRNYVKLKGDEFDKDDLITMGLGLL